MSDTLEHLCKVLDRDRRERERITAEWAKSLQQLAAQRPVIEAAVAWALANKNAEDDEVVHLRETRLFRALRDYQAKGLT